jgi:hypothetical protein
MTLIKCTKCGHTAPWDDWPKGRDFFQNPYVWKCLNPDCDNRQSPGGASMRMMPGQDHPFISIRPGPVTNDPLDQVLHNANEAS